MENRDFLMAQIEQVGKVLARAVSDAIGFKTPNDAALGLEKINLELNRQLDCDIFELLKLKKDEKVLWLEKNNIPIENAEGIANYFSALYEAKTKNGISCLKAAKELLVIVDQQTKSFSMERAHKMMKIDRKLIPVNQ
ncbi:MAG: hypothetical protein JKY54_11555 [Flavobacteriales bacterium]|nr:hypothetical protein [Flavobacteriales bacterium]